MSTNPGEKAGAGLKREAPPVVIALVIVAVVLAIGAGIFNVVNGGWQTQAQKDAFFTHDYLPLKALHHGNRTLFDQENALRQKEGRAPLVDKKTSTSLPREQREKAAQEARSQELTREGAAAPK